MAIKRPRRGRKSDRHRDRSKTTKLQIVFACTILAMLIAFGTDLSDRAAGCFHSVSQTPSATTPKSSAEEPTGTTIVRFTEPDTESGPESHSTTDATSQPLPR